MQVYWLQERLRGSERRQGAGSVARQVDADEAQARVVDERRECVVEVLRRQVACDHGDVMHEVCRALGEDGVQEVVDVMGDRVGTRWREAECDGKSGFVEDGCP